MQEGRLTLDLAHRRRSGPRSQSLTWVCVYVCQGGARETDLTPKCGRPYPQSHSTKKGPARTGSEFPVPGEPGTGKSWRWGSLAAPHPRAQE